MLKRGAMFLLVLVAMAGVCWGQQAQPAASQGTKHPVSANDWSTLRSARAVAVSTNKTILYRVAFGGEKGPTHSEWWTIAGDGTQAAKLELSDTSLRWASSPTGRVFMVVGS